MKKLIRFVGGLVVVLLVLAVGVVVYVDSIAKAAIERGATYALGVETTLGSADVKLLSGAFAMADLTVANPQGFESPYFTHLGQGDVKVAIKTLLQETVELPTLTLTNLDMHLEKKQGKANYDVILENLKRFESQENAQDDAEGKKFIIKEVLIKNIMVHVQLLPLGGSLTKLDVPIDEIRLENVGSQTGRGVVMSELTGAIIKGVLIAIVRKGGGLIPDDILGDLGQGLGSLAEIGVDAVTGLGDLINDAGGGLDEVTEGLGDAIKSIGDGLGGLLGGQKKKDD